MPVFQIPPELIRVGHATPFALRDKVGKLLIARGVMVQTESQRQQMIARDLYVDEQEGEQLKRAIAGKLDSMVRQNALIGQIAQASPDSASLGTIPSRRRIADPVGTWASLQMRTSAMQRDTTQPDFLQRVEHIQAALLDALEGDPDVGLLLLVQAAGELAHDYSVKHGLLVTAICELAARHLPDWHDETRRSLRCAALTMNVGMTALQNQLALQDGPLMPAQRQQIEAHAIQGARLLSESGITDDLWLEAVRRHHDSTPGHLHDLPRPMQLARLMQRADIFAARLSPRRRRPAMSATAAAKAAYLDENKQPDEAGSAIIKAIGIYPPGSLVRLGNGEVALVMRRGRQANEPAVLSVVSAAGTPLGVPVPRNTRVKPFEVVGGVAVHEVNVRLNPQALLKLA